MSLSESSLRSLLPGGPEQGRAPAPQEGLKPAAVLVALEPERGVWLTRRAMDLSNHAGQISFPGGQVEPGDASPEAAALREAQEEIALDPAAVEVLGRMDGFATTTGFFITPVLGLVPPDVPMKPAPAEVLEIFRLPFANLLDETLPQEREALYRGRRLRFQVWPYENQLIWGATARILAALAARLRGAA